MSSCLGKFLSSIINQRFVKFLETKKLLHPSQIGFLKDNRTSDHIFTLRTLIENMLIITIKKYMPVLLILKKPLILFGTKGFFFTAFKLWNMGQYLLVNRITIFQNNMLNQDKQIQN